MAEQRNTTSPPPKTVDARSQKIWLLLAVLGLFVALVSWYQWGT